MLVTFRCRLGVVMLLILRSTKAATAFPSPSWRGLVDGTVYETVTFWAAATAVPRLMVRSASLIETGLG